MGRCRRRDTLNAKVARTLALSGFAAVLMVSGCALQPGAVRSLVASQQGRSRIVATSAGPVRGVATPQGQAFLGIPFAAAPVGALRFRPPAPPPSWTEVRDATRPGPICVQTPVPGAGRQSEDCLNLNVYAPADADPAHPRAVMVWLYGGGFAIGDNLQYDPIRLAEQQGVVVVAPNYRLGPFGFLAHPGLRGAGEGAYALQDQQAALRWVRDNIAGFGGDPARVTLFGESAGAWSACYQMTAPGARGLFQRVILESGACTSPESAIALPAAEAGGERFARALGCGDPTTAADCLRAAPPEKLRNAKAARFGLLGINSWSPSFGGDVLPLEPRQAFETGAYMAVPMIDGSNRDEGRLFLYANRLKGKLWTRGSYEKIVRDFFDELTPQVLAEYGEEAERDRGLAYADLLTDSTFSCPALTLNALVARRAPVFAYEFDDPQAVFDPPRPPGIPPLMAYHSSDIAYVFETPWAIADPKRFDDAQQRLSRAMQDAWGAFARNGRPDAAGSAWSASPDVPLRFAPDAVAPTQDFAAVHRCGFWRPRGY